jgi:hypothetical protein
VQPDQVGVPKSTVVSPTVVAITTPTVMKHSNSRHEAAKGSKMSALSPCSLQTYDNDNIETNCFGGVTAKISEMMTRKEQVKHKLIPAPIRQKPTPFAWVTSPTRAFIEKPISELN